MGVFFFVLHAMNRNDSTRIIGNNAKDFLLMRMKLKRKRAITYYCDFFCNFVKCEQFCVF